MVETTVRCSEVEGKTIARLLLVRQEDGTQELLIEFTDDTALSVTLGTRTTRDARLIRQLEAGPETIRSYDDEP